MLHRSFALAFASSLLIAAVAHADMRRVWAVNDGEKVERDDTAHSARERN